jgi:general secretion pathway protein D
MLLRDGETAILGGLIRDDERNARVTIPGLGDVPAIGALLTSYDRSSGRTDVLLTITPHVVRGWDLLPQSEREFFSGTESTYSTKPLFASFADAVNSGDSSRAAMIARKAAVPALMIPDGAAKFADPVVLTFSEPSYEQSAGKEFEIELTGQNLPGISSAPIEVLYDPKVVSFVRADAGSSPAPKSFDAVADPDKGMLTLKLDYPEDAPAKGHTVVARLIMKGVAPGSSYLTYSTQAVVGAEGENIGAQAKASRVVIK